MHFFEILRRFLSTIAATLWIIFLGIPQICFAQAYNSDIWLNDNTQEIAIDQLRSAPEINRRPVLEWLNATFTQQSYKMSSRSDSGANWHRIDLRAGFTNITERTMHLVVGVHMFQHLDFYIIQNNQVLVTKHLGTADPPQDNFYRGANLAITIKNGEHLTILIRSQAHGPGILPLTLYSQNRFEFQQMRQYLLWGAAILTLLSIGLYNAFIYAMQPNPSYRWYLTFHLLAFLEFASLYGYGHLLWPYSIQHFLIGHVLTLNFLLAWVAVRLSLTFLNARHLAPRHYRIHHLFDILVLAGLALCQLTSEAIALIVFASLQIFTSIYCISMAITTLRDGYRPARYFIISWIFTIAGAAIGTMAYMNVVPANFFTLHAFMFGTMIELILLSLALTDFIKFAERQTLSNAYIDLQTNLPNFTYYRDHLPQQLQAHISRYKSLTLIIIKVTGFHELSGLLGPQIPTIAFQDFLAKLNQYLEKSFWSLPVRLPSGEFSHLVSLPNDKIALIAKTNHKLNEIETIGVELQKLANAPVNVRDVESKIGFIIGHTTVSNTNSNVLECLRQAEIAMMTAQHNHTSIARYEYEQDGKLKQRLEQLTELRRAINQDLFTINIQPQLHTDNFNIVSGEVLIRWLGQNGSFNSPGLFIPLAERSGLITDITALTFRKACIWLDKYKSSLPQNFKLSINLSVQDIENQELMAIIKKNITEFHVPPSQILFEITESASIENSATFFSMMSELKSMGFQLAIDDFGTGYSSLTYLQKIHADEIKLDITFIRNIHLSETNQRIVGAIIQLAHSMGMRTVAEGIEKMEELQTLRAMKCQIAQGYLLGKPIPADGFCSTFLGVSTPRVAITNL